MKLIPILLLWSYSNMGWGNNFQDRLKELANHEQARHLEHVSQEYRHLAEVNSSWGDPKLKVAAKNFPEDTLAFGETPMTGVEVGISQTIPLSDRRGLEGSAAKSLSNSISWEKEDLIRQLRLQAWELAISWTKKEHEIKSLQDSHEWLANKIEITQSLYANGQASQQAILEIQIRKSEVHSKIEGKKLEQEKIEEQLRYLFGSTFQLRPKEISWDLIESDAEGDKRTDAKSSALLAKLNSKTFSRKAQNSAQIPDITIGAGYTFRSDVDGRGDFVALSIGVPLPVSSKSSESYAASRFAESSARLAHEVYQKKLRTKVANLTIEKQRIESERKILAEQTLRFAEASRDIISKSYGLGNAIYVELLSSELSLQEVRLRDIGLWAELQKNKVTLKYLHGERLW